MLQLSWSTIGFRIRDFPLAAVNQEFPRPTNGGFLWLTMQRRGVLSSSGIKTPTNLVLKPGQFSEVKGDIKKTKQVSRASRSLISKVGKMGLMFNGRRTSAEVENPINHGIGDRKPLNPKLGCDGCKVMSMELWLGLIVPLEPTEDWKSWPPNLQGWWPEQMAVTELEAASIWRRVWRRVLAAAGASTRHNEILVRFGNGLGLMAWVKIKPTKKSDLELGC